jgi:hypothetical protein
VSFPGIFFFSALLEGLRRRQEQDAAALPKVPQPSSLRLAAEDIPSRGAEA